jgi:aminopeptidase N
MTSIGTAQLSSSRDLTTLFVHELAHQWWGDRVTMKTWDDLWLNEGFATYSEVLYLEKAQGLVPGRLLQSAYDDGLYAGALAFPVVASPSDPFRHSGSVYDKGAWALHMLRRSVGDDVFFRALRAYGDSNAFGNVTRADLRETFEKESGRDLKFFFDQWVETPFRPVLRATFKNALDLATVGVTLTQVQSHTVVHPAAAPSDVAWYRFPVKVRLDLADGTHEDHAVSLDTATTSVDLPNPSRKRVATMEVDPDGDLLAVVESVAEVM